jgi:tRNA nucleotidyltransferase (CCA-adding enzyme)
VRRYLVGGAVRDALLGLPVKDRDWVVVGATPEDMRAAGYRQVGADFPVFLHPQTNDEHALARTERKTAPGYRGFAVDFSPHVTLEEDLGRRDLTINAVAQAEDGTLVDPWGGRKDLDARVLRHVTAAFAEDPVRVLRVARFAARFAPLGFRVADETLALMRHMVEADEVDHLVPERVWQELARALAAPAPEVFIRTLRACGALARILPEVDRLYGVPQPAQHHPEVDTGVHVELVLAQAARLSPDPRVRFAALTHDLGKGTTDPARWPAHHGHEARSVRLLGRLCERLRAPTEFRELALAVARLHGNVHRALELRPATVLKVLEGADTLRRPERLEPFLLACEADYRGRPTFEDRPYPQTDLLRRAHGAARAVSAAPFVTQGLTGADIGKAIHRERVRAIRRVLPRPDRAGEPMR